VEEENKRRQQLIPEKTEMGPKGKKDLSTTKIRDFPGGGGDRKSFTWGKEVGEGPAHAVRRRF